MATSENVCKPLEPTVDGPPTCDAWEGHDINLNQLEETYNYRLNASNIDHTGFYNELVLDNHQSRREGVLVFAKLEKNYPDGYNTILDSTRYLHTISCAHDMFGWSDRERQSFPCPVGKGKKPLRKLCESTCRAAETSFRLALVRHVGDVYSIPAAKRLEDRRVLNALEEIGILFKKMCMKYSSQESNCVSSIKLEDNLCGFTERQIDFAREYCKSNATDACCKSNASLRIQEQDPAIFLGMSLKTVIAVSIGAGLGLLLLLVLIIFVCKRSRSKASDDATSKYGKLGQRLHIEHQPGYPYASQNDPNRNAPPRFNSLSRNKPSHQSMVDYTPQNVPSHYNNPNINPFAREYPPLTRYVVTADYNPEVQDELELRVGDIVYLTITYPDGWGYGKNEMTRLNGVVPLGILKRQNQA